MFVASRGVGLFDRFRVPYVVDPEIATGHLRIVPTGVEDARSAELLSLGATAGATVEACEIDGAIVFVALAKHQDFQEMIQTSGKDWIDETPVRDLKGRTLAVIRHASDQSVALPFDLDEAFDSLLEERYLRRSAGWLRGVVVNSYYRVRPLFPYWFQLTLRRKFRRFQERVTFPSWPTETSLHRLEGLILRLVERIAGEPVPWLAPWPSPYSWAIVLTHDVERAGGYERVSAFLDVEELHALRSAWYFVPERDYTVERSMLDELRERGCEICLHGLRHDGRDMSASDFYERLPAMRRYLEQWGALGFRAPSTHRNIDFLLELGVDHDSSWSDVARYEPQPGGTCSWLPFFVGDVVELPITLPMDHTLFHLLGERTGEQWVQKATFLREHGGMALMVTHPDYLSKDEYLRAYAEFLEFQSDDDTVWRALPREVAAWWRSRAESRIERSDGGWIVVGPAASSARVRLGSPGLPPRSDAVAFAGAQGDIDPGA